MSQWHDFTGLIPAMFTTFFYYGVMQIAIDVENPFNFADVDHDLDSFSKRLHDEKAWSWRARWPLPGRAAATSAGSRSASSRPGTTEKRKKKKRTGEGCASSRCPKRRRDVSRQTCGDWRASV